MSYLTFWTRRAGSMRAIHGLWLVAFALPLRLLGQTPTPATPEPAKAPPDTTKGKGAPFFHRTDMYVAAGFVGATMAFFPLDENIAIKLQNPNTQANQFANNTAKAFEFFGAAGPYIIGGSLYAAGWVSHKPGLRDLGWHGVESVIYAQALTGVLKGVLGRARPFVVNDSNPHDFKFFGGFSDADRTSFPSGHTTTAFAAAASVTSEARRHWPDKWWSTWLIGPVLYGGATMVGISRMYHNKHWASDVVMGAAIGTVSGYKVVDYSHAHPDNRLDRLILRTSAVPTPDGGVRVGFVLETP